MYFKVTKLVNCNKIPSNMTCELVALENYLPACFVRFKLKRRMDAIVLQPSQYLVFKEYKSADS